MSSNHKALRKSGSTVFDAFLWHRMAVSQLGIGELSIKDWPNDLSLSHLVDPAGWLGVWMLNGDEIAVTLLGQRLWDVAYVADDNCTEGVKPVDRSELNEDDDVLCTYDAFPIMPLEDVPAARSIRLQLTIESISNKVVIEPGGASLKPIDGLYAIEETLSAGEILPFPNREMIAANLFYQRCIEPSLRNEIDQRLSPGGS